MTTNPAPHIVRTETSYTAHHAGRVRAVARATWSDGSRSIVALCDIITRDGKKYESKIRR